MSTIPKPSMFVLINDYEHTFKDVARVIYAKPTTITHPDLAETPEHPII